MTLRGHVSRGPRLHFRFQFFSHFCSSGGVAWVQQELPLACSSCRCTKCTFVLLYLSTPTNQSLNPNQPISQPQPLIQPQTTLISTTIKLLIISNHNKISPIQQLPFNHNQPTSSTQPTTFSANLPIPQPILLTNISNSTILEATGLVEIILTSI